MADDTKKTPELSDELVDELVDKMAAQAAEPEPEPVADEAAADERDEVVLSFEQTEVPSSTSLLDDQNIPEMAPKDRSGSTRTGTPVPLTLLLACLALAAGIFLGRYVLTSLPSLGASDLATGAVAGKPLGKATLSESELDTVVGTYSYKGQEIEISARDAILSSSSLEAMKNADDSYDVPSADSVLAYARNEILNAEVEARQITVTDDEVADYATTYAGSADYQMIADQFGMDVETVKQQLAESAAVRKLYDEVVGDAANSEIPEAPLPPEDDNPDTITAEYAAYIINLLGDEWDVQSDTWARQDGPYYAQMKDMVISSAGASYSQAEVAYSVAYADYATQSENAQSLWTDYINGLLSGSSIQISSLCS